MRPRKALTGLKRRLVVHIEEDIYLRMHHFSRILRVNPSGLVERGLKMLARKVAKEYPREWLEPIFAPLPNDSDVTVEEDQVP